MLRLVVYYGVLMCGLIPMTFDTLGWVVMITYFGWLPFGALALWLVEGHTIPCLLIRHRTATIHQAILGGISAAAVVLSLYGLIHFAGWAKLSGEWSLTGLLIGLIAQQLIVATIEELAFRGVLQSLLVDRLGLRAGLIAAATLFGFFHLPNIIYKDVPLILIPVTVLTLTTMGIVFGRAFQRTRGHLALPIALHFGWNIVALGIEGKLTINTAAPKLLAGSDAWYPESGLLGLAGLLVLAGLVGITTSEIAETTPTGDSR